MVSIKGRNFALFCYRSYLEMNLLFINLQFSYDIVLSFTLKKMQFIQKGNVNLGTFRLKTKKNDNKKTFHSKRVTEKRNKMES